MMVFQNRRRSHRRKTVRFSVTVQVREYALVVGDITLCVATPHCPRICRSHPLPLTLTDRVVCTYTEPLRETPSAPLMLQTCASQMRRLLQYPGSEEDRMRVLIQLNIDYYEQLLLRQQSSKPPPLECLKRLLHGPGGSNDDEKDRMRSVLIQLNFDFYEQQLLLQQQQNTTEPPLLWDESTLQAQLGHDTTPVRIECLDDDDRAAQKLARPYGNRLVQEAIVKAVVTDGGQDSSKMYRHLQSTQSKSQNKARKRAVALQTELYGRSGLSIQTNYSEWQLAAAIVSAGSSKQQQHLRNKDNQIVLKKKKRATRSGGRENMVPTTPSSRQSPAGGRLVWT
jgi:hypothetical protein